MIERFDISSTTEWTASKFCASLQPIIYWASCAAHKNAIVHVGKVGLVDTIWLLGDKLK